MAIRDAPVVDWSSRYDQFVIDEATLDAGELDEFGQAAWFIGRDDVSERAWARAHLRYLADAVPGLGFVGLPFQYSIASPTLMGMGPDAEYVVEHLFARRPVTQPA
ncbi:MAG TPA: hypothetical protein VN107_11145 [Microbacterium sp.]|nr:hypothetical protein [Microbacterium sp.]